MIEGAHRTRASAAGGKKKGIARNAGVTGKSAVASADRWKSANEEAGRPVKPVKYAAIRKIALSFPGTQEIVAFGVPWFNIGTKSFALYDSRTGRWIFKLPQHQQMMLFDARPETFAPMRAGRMVWSYVEVGHLDAAELKDLLLAAWRTIASKKLQSGQPSTRPKQIT